MSKIKIDDIRSLLSEQNWKLISEEYKNLDSELIFICPEGHEVRSSWKKMRINLDCPVCNQNQLKNQDTTIIPKGKKVTRVLCLDQATQKTGFSIFDNGKLIRYGVFSATSSDETERIFLIKNWLINMINNWKPDKIGIEGIQFQQASEKGTIKQYESHMSITVFQVLARLQGVLLDVCYTMNIKCEVCPTNTWRNYCGVKGRTRAEKKKSMQALAKQWYDVSISDDEADAIGIGRYLSNKVGFDREIENWE